MIRFVALLAGGSKGGTSAQAFATYAGEVGPQDAAAAHALLTGTRPKRLAAPQTLLDWVTEATNTPAFLITACLAATPDKAELAALLLPQTVATTRFPTARFPVGPADALDQAALLLRAPHSTPVQTPTLTEALSALTTRDAYLALAQSLPAEARLILNRIATGTFRTKLAPLVDAPQNLGTCRAILTLIDPSGPEATFALPHGNALIPLCKLRLALPETTQILAWAKTHTTDRFGPLRQVAPSQIFELAFDGTTPNLRRKSGLDLTNPRLIAWLPSLTPDRATPLSMIQRL